MQGYRMSCARFFPLGRNKTDRMIFGQNGMQHLYAVGMKAVIICKKN
jgi:hypothetical protein